MELDLIDLNQMVSESLFQNISGEAEVEEKV